MRYTPLLALLCVATPALADGSGSVTLTAKRNPAPALYRIGVADELDIVVEGEPDYSRHVAVLSDGTISYPVLGQLRVSGLTLRELTTKLTSGLARSLIKPQVTVSILRRAEQSVSVLGPVQRPGAVALTQATSRVLDVLAAAGGLTVEKPDWATATLVRAGGTSAVPLDLAALLTAATPENNPVVAPGDILLIAERDKATRQCRIMGEVRTPGSIVIPADGSVVSALLSAGGATPEAALSKAVITRGGQTIPVDLRPLLEPSAASTPNAPRLEPGDTLFVPRNERRIAVLGAVTRPGIVLLPEEGTVDVLEALTLVGGGSSVADLSKVALIRGGLGNGTDTSAKNADASQIVSLNLTERLKPSKNGKVTPPQPLLLQPGDVIFVTDKRQQRPWETRDLIGLVPILSLLRR